MLLVLFAARVPLAHAAVFQSPSAFSAELLPIHQFPVSIIARSSPFLVQGFGFVLDEFHEDPVGLFLKPV